MQCSNHSDWFPSDNQLVAFAWSIFCVFSVWAHFSSSALSVLASGRSSGCSHSIDLMICSCKNNNNRSLDQQRWMRWVYSITEASLHIFTLDKGCDSATPSCYFSVASKSFRIIRNIEMYLLGKCLWKLFGQLLMSGIIPNLVLMQWTG